MAVRMWRETLAIVWHWLTTTRYTRRLEAEIEILKQDNERLRLDNDGLLKALYPAIKAVRTEREVRDQPREPIAPFRW